MKSKWYDKKDDAIRLRSNGVSIRTIEKSLNVPRSTLSGWFKGIKLNASQQIKLTEHQLKALALGRKKAEEYHRDQKQQRLSQAKSLARGVLDGVEISPEILDLALAMLYMGQGKKTSRASVGNSNPMVLRFVLRVLDGNYRITPNNVTAELHLRSDQDAEIEKQYWSDQLSIPLSNFKYVHIDKRTIGRASYDGYHGVCFIHYGNIAIQRKLIYLYNLFCQRVSKETGV